MTTRPHSDTPIDRTELQIRLLMDRIAVWVFKAHAHPIREAARRKMAELMLEEFDVRAKWVGNRPVFEAPEPEPGTFVELEPHERLVAGKIVPARMPETNLNHLTEAQLDHLAEGKPITVRAQAVRAQAEPQPAIPFDRKDWKTFNDDNPDDKPTDTCPVCLGRTKVCFTCNLPEGTCTHVRFSPVICPACDGTGKDPNA